MTSRRTIKEEIIDLKARLETRDKFVDAEREDVKEDIKQLTSDVSKIESNVTAVNTEVYNLSKTVDEVKIDVKDGFNRIADKMDGHFNHRSSNRVKKGAILAGIPTIIVSIGAGVWQLGILVRWWA